MNNGNNKVTIDCPFCKQRFSVAMPPSTRFNDLRVSTVVASHEKPVRCPNVKCAKRFVFAIGQAQIAWALIPLTDEQASQLEDSRIIVPQIGLGAVN